VNQIDTKVQELFSIYSWPGNVRELENLIERLILIAKNNTITIDDIPDEMKSATESQSALRYDLNGKSFKDAIKEQTEEVEKGMIIKTLEECEGNVTRAANQLGVSRKGLQLKMIKYNLRK
jgi:DNA-binding NtrC family response regulator